jgi:CRISPR-associated endonuclease Csn1
MTNNTITRTILGLDIGKASCGWSIVKIDEKIIENEAMVKYINPETLHQEELEYKTIPVFSQVIGGGVRVWDIPENKDGQSLAKIRGESRRARRTIRRKSKRMEDFLKYCQEIKLLDDSVDIKNKESLYKTLFKNDPEIYFLRNKALAEKLNNIELVRVIYNILKHRGFYWTSKADNTDKDKGKVKTGIEGIKNKLEENGYKTIGQMFHLHHDYNKQKRNSKDNYTNSIARELLEQELKEIFKVQKIYFSNIITSKFEDKIIHLLYKTAEINENQIIDMLANCELEKEEKVAPSKSYAHEYFAIVSKLNNIIIRTYAEQEQKNTIERCLTRQEIDLLTKKIFDSAKLTYTQARKLLNLAENERFNMVKYSIANPEYKEKIILKDAKEKEDKKSEVKNSIDVMNESTDVCDTIDFNKNDKLIEYMEKNSKKDKIEISYYFLRGILGLDTKQLFVDLEKKDKYEKSLIKCNNMNEYLKQFEKDTLFEAKGYRELYKAFDNPDSLKLWEEIKTNPNILNKIAKVLAYYKEDNHREKHFKLEGLENLIANETLKNALLSISFDGTSAHSFKALEKITPLLQQINPNTNKFYKYMEAKKYLGYKVTSHETTSTNKYLKHLQKEYAIHLKNPWVARIYSNVRKLVNAINREYSKLDPNFCIDQINIETAKELKHSKKQAENITKLINENKNENEIAKEHAQELLGSSKGYHKLKFLKQQNNCCIYCNKALLKDTMENNNAEIINAIEVDHIWPISRSMMNDQNNKVSVCKACNQSKSNQTAYEFMNKKGEQAFNEYVARVNANKSLPYVKKQRLLKNITKEDTDKFLSRDLINTAYASKFIIKYLRDNFDFTKSTRDDIKNKIQVRSGRITAMLRNSWLSYEYKKDRDENNLHHYMDALILAHSTQGLVSFISSQVENAEKQPNRSIEKYLHKYLKPFAMEDDKFDTWKQDLVKSIDNIFVSKAPRRKTTKNYHKDTISAKSKFKVEDLADKFKVRKGYAEKGEMVRADMFESLLDKNKGNLFMVPIYSTDLSWSKNKKPFPNTTIDGITMDENYKFKFSLYKDDLISYSSKNNPETKFYYVSYVRADGSVVNVENIDNSPFKFNKDGKPVKAIEKGLQTAKIKKYQIDLLGNKQEIKEEKRVFNITKNPKHKVKK